MQKQANVSSCELSDPMVTSVAFEDPSERSMASIEPNGRRDGWRVMRLLLGCYISADDPHRIQLWNPMRWTSPLLRQKTIECMRTLMIVECPPFGNVTRGRLDLFALWIMDCSVVQR